ARVRIGRAGGAARHPAGPEGGHGGDFRRQQGLPRRPHLRDEPRPDRRARRRAARAPRDEARPGQGRGLLGLRAVDRAAEQPGRKMRDPLLRLRTDLGRGGLLALALLVAAFAFHAAVVRPLGQKNAALALELAQAKPAPVERAGARLERFYEALERTETVTDWLAKLYAISTASGLEMKSATYRTHAPAK